MTERTRVDIKANALGNIAPNGRNEINAVDVRDAIIDLADSAAFGAEVAVTTDALDARVDALEIGQDGGAVAFQTFTELEALPGSYAGQRGFVTNHAGTHTDPVTAGTVLNQGEYRWSASPAGWTWIRVYDNSTFATVTSLNTLSDDRHIYAPFVNRYQVAICDAAGKILVGREMSLSQAIPASPFKHPRTKRIGKWYNGQSLAGGTQGTTDITNTALTTSAPYGFIKTFGSGLSSIPNPTRSTATTNNSPGVTTEITAVESVSQGAWGTWRGETGIVQGAAYLAELAQEKSGVALDAHTYFVATAYRGSRTIDTLSKNPEYHHLAEQVAAAKALADTAGEDFEVRTIAWIQGEADADELGLPHTARTVYRDALIALAAQNDDVVAGYTNQSAPVFTLVMQTSHLITPANSNGEIALAQTDACALSPLLKFVCPEWHVEFYGDSLHKSANGYIHLGLLIGRAEHQLIFEGRDPDYLKMISAVYRPGKLRLKYVVPKLPLVIDTITWGTATQLGVRFLDGTGDIALSSPAVVDGDTLEFTTARAPTGTGIFARVGMDYLPSGVSGGVANLAGATFRDSTTDEKTLFSVTHKLWHVPPAAEIPVTVFA